ncbi:hypothetical protein LTR28_003170 [Elasticomyces elasticus]|nr:hypothetical protein LTR28_003170 [Elasticomyces elasticus]
MEKKVDETSEGAREEDKAKVEILAAAGADSRNREEAAQAIQLGDTTEQKPWSAAIEPMNGFANRSLDEDNFGESKTVSAVKAFDAFPKTKPSYTTRTSAGGIWTVFLILASTILTFTELRRWFIGTTTHTFSVEKGISHDLQINLDIVIPMHCSDIHINVQDASGDRILAGEKLERAPTTWLQWQGDRGRHQLRTTREELLLGGGAGYEEYGEEDVHDYLHAARRKRKFAKTPKLPRGVEGDACRVFGSLEGNKVQGDFHITARGHGYMEFGQHLDHSGMFLDML